MTARQQILKWIYPLFIRFKKIKGEIRKLEQVNPIPPAVSFYTLSALLNDGKELSFENLKGKNVLIVNTASDCGYTHQYSELQELYQKNKETLLIIGFPSNDFKEQEKGTDEDIAQFCKINYGVTFPLAKKSSVVPGHDQNPVFQWLSDKNKNGWTNKKPSWNFSKYLVNEEGVLTNYFDPSISPTSKEVVDAVHK